MKKISNLFKVYKEEEAKIETAFNKKDIRKSMINAVLLSIVLFIPAFISIYEVGTVYLYRMYYVLYYAIIIICLFMTSINFIYVSTLKNYNKEHGIRLNYLATFDSVLTTLTVLVLGTILGVILIPIFVA